MKLSLIVILSAVLSVATSFQAEARPQARTTMEKLHADLSDFTNLFARQDCLFSARPIKGGYLIRIVDEKKNVLEVEMTGLETLKLKSQEDSDGSFEHYFRTANGAAVIFTHADDAYDHVTLFKGQQKLKCELDY